jgi:hypothetical protein
LFLWPCKLIHPYNQMCYSLCSLTLFASMLCAQQC